MKELEELYINHAREMFGDTFSKDMYQMVFLSQLNSYAIQLKPIIKFDGNHPFSLSIFVAGGTGTGKGASIEFLSPITKEVTEIINDVYKHRYDKLYYELNKKDDIKNGEFTVTTCDDRHKRELAETFERYPKDITLWSRAGTWEGLSQFYQAYSTMGMGSIGVTSNEFADHYQDGNFKKLLETVAEMYNDINPSSLKITASKGAEKASNIQSSVFLAGSFEKFKRTHDLLENFRTFLASSLARRTLFFFLSKEESDNMRVKKIDFKRKKIQQLKESKEFSINHETEYFIELKKRILEVIKYYAYVFTVRSNLQPDLSFENLNFVFTINKEAYIRLLDYSLRNNEIANELVHTNKSDKIMLADEIDSRHFKALRVAALSNFYKLEANRVIDIDDVEYGIEVAEKSGNYYKIISRPTIIVDEICDYLYKAKSKATVKELEDLEIMPRNMSKHQLNCTIDRCKEYAYQNNNIFRSTLQDNSMIPQVWIENLEETKDEIAHITYSTVAEVNDATMKPISLNIYEVLNIPDVKKIGIGGFANDHRHLDNITKLGNVLILDVDDGIKLPAKDAKLRLKGLVGFLYPTKHHRKEKNGVVCDRYRIILLCKQSFPFGENKKTSENEYKGIYRSVCEHFDIPFDSSCCEASRFFWIPDESKSETILEQGRLSESGKGKLLDLRFFMKNLKISSDMRNYTKKFESKKYWNAIGVKGMLEKTLANAIITGQRNNNLLILALNLMDYGLDYNTIKDYVYDVDSKFPDSLGSLQSEGSEIDRTILTTLKKKMEEKGCYPEGIKAEKKDSGFEFEINKKFYDTEEVNDGSSI